MNRHFGHHQRWNILLYCGPDHAWHSSLRKHEPNPYHRAACYALPTATPPHNGPQGPHHEPTVHSTNTASSASDHSPLGLLLNAYDQAIAACRAHNTPRAYRTILTLREAHPCDSPSSAGIDGLYAFCERAILTGDFLGAARTLEQLRSAWQTADRITNVPREAMSRPLMVKMCNTSAELYPPSATNASPLR